MRQARTPNPSAAQVCVSGVAKSEEARGSPHPGGLDSADRKARTWFQFSAAPLGLRASISVEEPCTPNFGTYSVLTCAGAEDRIARPARISSASDDDVT